MTDMADVSRGLDITVTHDRKEGTITIIERGYTEDHIERFGIKNYNPRIRLV